MCTKKSSFRQAQSSIIKHFMLRCAVTCPLTLSFASDDWISRVFMQCFKFLHVLSCLETLQLITTWWFDSGNNRWPIVRLCTIISIILNSCQTIPSDNSSSTVLPTSSYKPQQKAALAILSQIMRDWVTQVHTQWQIFIMTPYVLFRHNKRETVVSSTIRLTSQDNDLSAFVLDNLLPSAERMALDRSFTRKWVCGCWESKWQINRVQQRKDVCWVRVLEQILVGFVHLFIASSYKENLPSNSRFTDSLLFHWLAWINDNLRR